MRLAICGAPRSGKTTLADDLGGKLNVEVLSTDTVAHLGWSESSAEVATWFDRTSPFIIEGVAVIRAARKWLRAHPEGRPFDKLLLMWVPLEPTKPGHVSMAKGVETVLAEIAPELRRRGVVIEYFAPPLARPKRYLV